jgi:hypothetical protein
MATPAPLFWPAWIALSGLIPYLVLAAWIPFASDALAAGLVRAMIAYAAVVLGFLGGVRWGAELTRAPEAPHLRRLIAAGLQTVPAWIAVLMLNRPLWALTLLAAAGLAHLTWDLAGVRAGLLPAWTYRLRIGLTLIGFACLAVAALSSLRLI